MSDFTFINPILNTGTHNIYMMRLVMILDDLYTYDQYNLQQYREIKDAMTAYMRNGPMPGFTRFPTPDGQYVYFIHLCEYLWTQYALVTNRQIQDIHDDWAHNPGLDLDVYTRFLSETVPEDCQSDVSDMTDPDYYENLVDLDEWDEIAAEIVKTMETEDMEEIAIDTLVGLKYD